jgi:hypothetical protein
MVIYIAVAPVSSVTIFGCGNNVSHACHSCYNRSVHTDDVLLFVDPAGNLPEVLHIFYVGAKGGVP